VVEPALGLNRLLLAMMTSQLVAEQVEGRSDSRVLFRVQESLAPIQASVLPLQSAHQSAAARLFETLLPHMRVELDSHGSIGKRYRRADEVGTPLCVTVDQENPDSVTIRDRDSMLQKRIAIPQLLDMAKQGELAPSSFQWGAGDTLRKED
jgi:glycyl-tRNA synthetase